MNKKGFTLIELLVVIAIIGLLSTLAVVSLSGARTKARDAKRTSDLRTIQSALELYRNENADALPLGTQTWANFITATTGGLGNYLSGPLLDPTNSGTNVYTYCANHATAPTKYFLASDTESTAAAQGVTTAINAVYVAANCINSLEAHALVSTPATFCATAGNFCLGAPGN